MCACVRVCEVSTRRLMCDDVQKAGLTSNTEVSLCVRMNMPPFGELNHPSPSLANWCCVMKNRVGVGDHHTTTEMGSEGGIVHKASLSEAPNL